MQLKRTVLFMFLVMGSTSSQAALTQNQVKQVKSSINQMELTLQQMMRLALETGKVLDNGNTFVTAFSTVSFSLSSQQQQDIVNYYQSLKAQLQSQLNTLP